MAILTLQFYQFKNLIYLFISLCCLQFLSSVFYSCWIPVFYLLRLVYPKYFILFDAMVIVIVSFIFLSDGLFSLYRNATALSALIFYPAPLQNSLKSSYNFISIMFYKCIIVSCNLLTVNVSCLPLQFGFLYLFPFSDCWG